MGVLWSESGGGARRAPAGCTYPSCISIHPASPGNLQRARDGGRQHQPWGRRSRSAGRLRGGSLQGGLLRAALRRGLAGGGARELLLRLQWQGEQGREGQGGMLGDGVRSGGMGAKARGEGRVYDALR